jgi:hypothetical protein
MAQPVSSSGQLWAEFSINRKSIMKLTLVILLCLGILVLSRLNRKNRGQIRVRRQRVLDRLRQEPEAIEKK